MSTQKTNVETLGEALSVLVQVAELSQAKGILSLNDAVIVKSAVDFINALNNQNQSKEQKTEETVEGPKA
jgi:hypothetical protein